MQSKSISNYIYLGLSWRFLQDAKAPLPIHGDRNILNNIEVLLGRLDNYGLVVTKRAASDLITFRDTLKELETNAVLTAEQATSLNNIMYLLQSTLLAEAGGKLAYIVTDKRLDVNKLLENPKDLLAPNVFDALCEIARYDISAAGRCIAFEQPTSAAFHILRGTEKVLRTFYIGIVRRGRVSPLLWGPMTGSLRRRRSSPPLVLLNNLDNIRLSFRNPTLHPEKIYDIQEVQDLFSLCIDVINRMVRSEFWNSNT